MPPPPAGRVRLNTPAGRGLSNSSYTFRFMSYSGSDLVRCSVTGSSLGRSVKLTKRPIDGSRGVWAAQRPNEGEKAGSSDKLHRFEWTEQRRGIVRNISILSFLLASMWFPHRTGRCAKKWTHSESFFGPGAMEILRISKFNCAHRIQSPKTHIHKINGGFPTAISKIFKKLDSLYIHMPLHHIICVQCALQNSCRCHASCALLRCVNMSSSPLLCQHV